MRYLRFSIFLSIIVIATAIFLPYVQMEMGGLSFGRKTKLSLYTAFNDAEVADKLSAQVQASQVEKIANTLLLMMGRKALPLKKHLEDSKSTLEDIRKVQKQVDLKNRGPMLRIASQVFLGLLAILAWFVLQSISQRKKHRRRSLWILLLSTISTVIGITLFITVREAMAMVNTDIGTALLSMAYGSYIMLAATFFCFFPALMIVLLEAFKTGKRQTNK